jgi:small subunit ribosomal protein S29e
MYKIQQTSTYCRSIQNVIHECTCQRTEADRATSENVQQVYNDIMQRVADDYYQRYANFSVRLQPGLSQIQLSPQGHEKDGWSLNLFSRLDCYHPNLCGNALVGGLIWNNMFQSKDKKLVSDKNLYCPKISDFLQ